MAEPGQRPQRLTDEERHQGYERRDPETGELLRRGWMTRAETKAHLVKMGEFWRRELADPDKRPEFPAVWVRWIGWCRVGGKPKAARGKP